MVQILQLQRLKSKLINFSLLFWILIELRIFVNLGTQTARVLYSFPFSKNRPVTRFYSVAMPSFQKQSSSQEESTWQSETCNFVKKETPAQVFSVNFVYNVFDGCWLLPVSVTLSFSSLMLYSKFNGFRYFYVSCFPHLCKQGASTKTFDILSRFWSLRGLRGGGGVWGLGGFE